MEPRQQLVPEWVLMLLFGVVFCGIGLAMVVGSFFVSQDAMVLVLAGLVFAAVGLVPVLLVPRARRRTRRARGLVRTAPAAGEPASGTPRPWPVAAVAAAMAEALDGTPYVVEHNADTIEVDAELLDRDFQVLATQRGLRTVLSVRLVARRPGLFERTDTLHEVAWEAGVPRLGATLRVSSGRVWRYQRRIELGVGPDGVSREVDLTFSTGDVDRPLREVTARAGWRVGLGPDARGAVAVAAIGASAVVLVPLALLLRWLLGH